MGDFIQAAKTKKMKYATYGTLSLPHILTEAMGKKAGFQPIHVPFAGGGPAFTAALGGHVDMAAANSMAGLIGPGRLRILAVGLDRRFETYPEVPTLAELGFPCSYGEFSIWAPQGTPKERINKIYEAFKKATEENKKEITTYLLSVEQKLTLLGPEEMWKDTQTQYKVLKKLIGEMGLLADQHK